MKRNFLLFLTVLLVSFLTLSSCEKAGITMESSDIGIDPELNPDGFNRVLQTKGHFFEEEDLPAATPGPGLVVSQTQRSIESPEGEDIFLPFTVKDIGLAKVCGVNIKVANASGYWNIPVTTNQGNSYFIELSIPRMVKQGEFTFVYNVEICYNGNVYVSDTINTNISYLPELQCGDTLSGVIGLQLRKYNLGNKAGKVMVKFGTGKIGDRLDIRQGKNYIFSTGTLLAPGKYPTCGMNGFVVSNPNANDKYLKYLDYTFDYDPSKGTSVVVMGYGHCEYSDTAWKLILLCPE